MYINVRLYVSTFSSFFFYPRIKHTFFNLFFPSKATQLVLETHSRRAITTNARSRLCLSSVIFRLDPEELTRVSKNELSSAHLSFFPVYIYIYIYIYICSHARRMTHRKNVYTSRVCSLTRGNYAEDRFRARVAGSDARKPLLARENKRERGAT